MNSVQPPPAVPVRSLPVDEQIGPLPDGRQLFIDSVDLYDDYGDVNYRLRPARPPHRLPSRPETTLFRNIVEFADDPPDVRVRPVPDDQLDDGEWDDVLDDWQLEVEDDLGTKYETPSGASGIDADEVHGTRVFSPAPPPSARRLTLTVYTDDDAADDVTQVGEVRVSLTDPGATQPQ